MCAIAGLVDKRNAFTTFERETVVEEMLRMMEHRGRDCTGITSRGQVTLGHNRLAITDLSIAADQPIEAQDGKLLMAYNGEIYNHLELRNTHYPHKYKTASDTESLLAAYVTDGNKVFARLRGMYAVSILNTATDSLVLAVDRFGIKPLYYVETSSWIAWASELKAFIRVPGFSFEVDPGRLFEQGVFRTTVGEKTIAAGVRRLVPGECLNYNLETSLTAPALVNYKEESEKKECLGLLKDSVQEHLMGDVPIGLQLSGGVDSSFIAALACEARPWVRFHTFSIGLADPAWNEFPYSRAVAEQLGTMHHEIVFTQHEFCALLPLATYHLDEPVAYPNTVPLLILAREAQKYVKVLLSGEGADELFGGYRRYPKLAQFEVGSEEILLSNSFCTPEMAKLIFTLPVYELSVERIQHASVRGERTSLGRLGTYDLNTFLPSLLLRQDKTGMASTIESRFPFLDPRVVAYAKLLTDADKCGKVETKRELKRLASQYLPTDIVYREKCGFGLPISDWLRDPQGLGKYLSLIGTPVRPRSYLNYAYIQELIDGHLASSEDYSEVLWILITLEVWTLLFVEGRKPDEIWNTL